MNASLKSVLFTFLVVAAGGLTNTANAQVRAELRLFPGSSSRVIRISPVVPITPVVPETPRLGIYGHFEFGYGMVVDSVVWGTPAARSGLESGDVIRAINGRWINSQSDYFRALAYSGGYARLLVQDVRTGALVSRTAYLDGIDYYSDGSIAGIVR
jgi:Trypsin-like serine proteases, typically periplasmic, contain C-terminal PDZ domain